MLKTKDPYLLLSIINTKLRDEASSLQDLCLMHNQDMKEIKNRLEAVGYKYDATLNQFITQ